MSKQVLFIHGAGDQGYESDKALVASLQSALGKGYDVNYPHLNTDETAPDFGWIEQIAKRISAMRGEFILAGHSLGASMVLKYLSENKITETPAAIFLISAPFWSGDEEWKKGFTLQENFADKLPIDVPVFLYHCRDDEEVPFSHFGVYRQKLKAATFREIASGGHQLNNHLAIVAKDIQSV